MTKVVWVLEWDFHLYTVNFEEKEVNREILYFDRFEELLATYRKKKNALFMGCLNYNTNFKLYKGNCEEADIKSLDELL
ncbi:hypothetical protein C3V36_11105 [Lachnospiraceae bacterium oral taxon 500]|nr:hypothetical protein C3V36_11105 [Lachnospiraceae bacterium oral taxon 500]